MVIKRYREFLLTEADDVESDSMIDDGGQDPEDYVGNDTPESYIKNKLKIIQKKIDNMFSKEVESSSVVSDVNSSDLKSKIRKKDSESMSFEDLGMSLESSELSKMTKTHQTLTIKFADNINYYSLLIKIDLKQVVENDLDDGEGMSTGMIKKCFVKFKKYKIDGFDLLGELSKNIKINDLSEDFLINLKIELDDEFGDDSDGDDFEIEYD